MNRERFDVIIEDLWQQEKKKNGKSHGDRLAFQNKYLAARLEEESPEVIEAVNKYREDDIISKLKQLEAMESTIRAYGRKELAMKMAEMHPAVYYPPSVRVRLQKPVVEEAVETALANLAMGDEGARDMPPHKTSTEA